MIKNFSNSVYIFFFISCLIFNSVTINAGTINELKALSFGTIALKNNNANYVMNIAFSGQIISDPEIIIITPGHPAEYELSNFSPDTQLNIDIIVPDTETKLAGQTDASNSQFTITNHHTFNSIVTTNSLGSAIINVGATLTSSGSGYYKDATYYNYMTIMVNY